MSDEVLIKVDKVSKKFCRNLKKSLWYGIHDLAGEVIGRNGNHARLRPEEFWAVNDLSFELRRGECLGLIGRNGAGKTTLLKMLNGLIKPDRGRIEMRGRVGALIALGAGFNPVLTGRENIYVNGSVLGLSKREIDAKIDEIIDFAEIEEFIDSPVQSYSSGMQVRLGFAVATALNPDVLLIDEVIAVGDSSFRSKCYNRIDRMRKRCSVILVSHNMEHIGRVCNSGFVLHKGVVGFCGSTEKAIGIYNSINSSATERFIKSYWPISNVRIQCSEVTHYGAELSIMVSLHTDSTIEVVPRLIVMDDGNQVIAEANYKFNRLVPINLHSGEHEIRIRTGPCNFRGGRYLIHVNLHDQNGTLLVGGFNIVGIHNEAPTIGESSTQLNLSMDILK